MTVKALLDRASQLPSIPRLVQELLQMFDDPNSELAEIARRVQLDQALTAKVLRLANSSFYGSSRKISTVNEAVVMLGFDALRTLVLACGVTGAFVSPPGFDINAFWRRSFYVAGLCRWIVRRGPLRALNADGAFTAGMLHDVGYLLLATVDADRLQQIESAVAAGTPRAEAEMSVLGCSAPEIGAALLQRWQFPDVLREAVLHQNAPLAGDPPSAYAQLVAVAKALYTRVAEKGDAEGIEALLQADVVQALGLDVGKLADRWDELDELGGDMDALLK
jgi:HD-like signal output (HDOD) protein